MSETPPKPSSLQPTTNHITTLKNPLTRSGSISVPKGLHARLASPNLNVALGGDPLTRDNRIALLLDASGSMRGDKNAKLRDACVSFVNACNFSDTSVSIECFGADIRQPLTCFHPLLMTTVMTIPAEGGTPLAESMEYVLTQWPLTRAVVVSDGQPDRDTPCYEWATRYAEAGVPCDCVHIGASAHGEACLQRIAELSGGRFIKFSDITSFAKSFKYLTPAFYGVLTSGGVTANELGAKEIK
jgi:uncharacterized protein YegL